VAGEEDQIKKLMKKNKVDSLLFKAIGIPMKRK
jgi:hypothetical protein